MSVTSFQSPAPTRTGVRTGVLAATGTVATFGTIATTVPNTIMMRPIQIHGTSGFTCALMIGRPVLSFLPS